MLKGAKGAMEMNTMKKAGIVVLGLALPLLLLTAGPVSAANLEFNMWVTDLGGTKITDLTNLAVGDYNLVVQARVINNLSANRYITPSGTPKTASYDIYGALQNWAFNLVDSTGTGAASALNFADDTTGAWLTTAGTKAPYPNPTAGLLNTTGLISGNPVGNFDVLNVGASVGITALNLSSTGANLGRYGGYGEAATGFSTTTGLGGSAPAAPTNDNRWFTLVTGGFNYSGGYAQLSMDLNPGIVKENVATNAGSNGAVFSAPQLSAANVLAASTLTFGVNGGGPVEIPAYDTAALAGLNGGKAALGLVASWHHTMNTGLPRWWDEDPTAWITLDATGAGTFANYQWKITDVNGSHAVLTLGSTTSSTTVTVAQLIAAGFTAPKHLENNNGQYTFADVSLSVFDASANWGASGTAGNALLLPEPASLVVLAFGAVGALLRRRRRS